MNGWEKIKSLCAENWQRIHKPFICRLQWQLPCDSYKKSLNGMECIRQSQIKQQLKLFRLKSEWIWSQLIRRSGQDRPDHKNAVACRSRFCKHNSLFIIISVAFFSFSRFFIILISFNFFATQTNHVLILWLYSEKMNEKHKNWSCSWLYSYVQNWIDIPT